MHESDKARCQRARYTESNNILKIRYTVFLQKKNAFIVRFCLKTRKEECENTESCMSKLLTHVCREKSKTIS